MWLIKRFYIFLVNLLCCFSFQFSYIPANSSEALSESFQNVDQEWHNYKKLCSENGCVCERHFIFCSGISPHAVNRQIYMLFPNVTSLTFTDCSEDVLDFRYFHGLKALSSFSAIHCGIRNFIAFEPLQKLKFLDLSYNSISDWSKVIGLLRRTPNLLHCNLAKNSLTTFWHNSDFPAGLLHLNVSFNKMKSIDKVPAVKNLDLSGNRFFAIGDVWPKSIVSLNLSANFDLHSLNLSGLPNLEYLDLSGTSLSSLPITNCTSLRAVFVSGVPVEYIDFDKLQALSLETVDFSECKFLSFFIGQLPENITSFSLSGSRVSSFPEKFFEKINSLTKLNLIDNRLSNTYCLRKWCNYVPIDLRNALNCTWENGTSCTLGIDIPLHTTQTIVRVPFGNRAILPCDAFGEPPLIVEWWLVKPKKLIGTYETGNKNAQTVWSRNDLYRVLVGGYLSILNSKKSLVERYQCIATNEYGNTSHVVHFRLDYSAWFGLKYPTAVFWGSVLASLCFCAVSFLFNISWIVSRKVVLWWIKRTGVQGLYLERLSRVRKMVEACEKYRQKQMENLHDGYRHRIEQIRENYHQQVEQLRASYASQAERFRGYRAAQKTYVNQHLDSIRENYNQQMCRLREYGSRRAEQLWESYERQMNRIRTFSLQQRLRLIRQYRVKQQYINNLLEKFGESSPASSLLPPQAEEAVLDPLRGLDASSPLSRSESYYSLPEYVLDEEGELHCPPKSDIPSHMLSRHFQPKPSRTGEEDVPTTSKVVHFRKTDADADVAYETYIHPLRRHSLFEATTAGANVFSTTVAEIVQNWA